MDLSELRRKSNEQLIEVAIEIGIAENGATPKRQDLMVKILNHFGEKDGRITATGILSIVNEGYGFLRQDGSHPGAGDVYVSQSQIRRFGLRTGDEVSGNVRPPKDGERYFGLVRVEEVNQVDAESSRNRPHFEYLTPVSPLIIAS